MASGTVGGRGRFLPGDPRTSEPYRLTPQTALRVAILAFLALGVFAVLFLRLWALQVLSGERYLAQANDNRVRTLRLEAPRGPILDQNGHILVENVPGTRLELWPADLPKTWHAELKELKTLSMVTGVSVTTMVAQLRQHGSDPLTPIVVQRGLRQDQIDYLEERAAEFPGVQTQDSYLRKYPYQSLGAQVLGYVGQITAQEYKREKKAGYQPTDSIGQAGVESTYDTYLRGKNGTAQLTVDSRGRPKGPATLVAQPNPGESLRLTLNIGLQRAAEKALRYGITLAHTGIEGAHADGGAIVAMDPRNGAVLAMASYPTYQPSIYVGHPDPQKLAPVLNPTKAATLNYPGINRAIDAAYPPGSTFKPVTALAAMQEGLVHPFDQILCSPDFKDHGQTFHNWTPLIDQYIDLPTALGMSCDTYFYELGKRFYNLPPGPRPPAAGLGQSFRPGRADGDRYRPGGEGLDPDARVSEGAVSGEQGLRHHRPHLEAGLLDPDGDRPGADPRHAAPDDPPLRDDRQRRQARDAAPRRRRRVDGAERPAGARPPPVRRPAGPGNRRRPDCAALRPAGARRGERTLPSAPAWACSAASRSTSPARPAAPRRT